MVRDAVHACFEASANKELYNKKLQEITTFILQQDEEDTKAPLVELFKQTACYYNHALGSPASEISHARQCMRDIGQLLIKAGVTPNTNIAGINPYKQHNSYETLLQVVIERDPDNIEMVQFLLAHGAEFAQFSSAQFGLEENRKQLTDVACNPEYNKLLHDYGVHKYTGLRVLIPMHDEADYHAKLANAYRAFGAEVQLFKFQDHNKKSNTELAQIINSIDLLAIPGEGEELPNQEAQLTRFYKTLISKCLTRNIPIDGECAGNQRLFQALSGKDTFRSSVDGHLGSYSRRGKRKPVIHDVTITPETSLHYVTKMERFITDSEHTKRLNTDKAELEILGITMEASMVEEDRSLTIEGVSTQDSTSTLYPIGRSTQFHPSATMHIPPHASIKQNRLDAALFRKEHREKFSTVLLAF